jgi:hypothetical protein
VGNQDELVAIGYLFAPSQSELIERSPTNPYAMHLRSESSMHMYPTRPTARSLREGSVSKGITGETLTYHVQTKLPFPVVWSATEAAKKRYRSTYVDHQGK